MNTTDAIGTTEPAVPEKCLSSQPAHVSAASLWLFSLVLFRRQLISLASLSFHDERSSHILLIPLMSAFLIFLQRKQVFRAPCYCPSIGVPLLLLAGVFWYRLQAPLSHLNSTDQVSVVAALIVLVWIGAFILCYGTTAFKAAAFPLLFLSLMIPIPVAMAEKTVSVLQRGSAETCHALFGLLGVPFIQHGLQFSLPGVNIEIAEQCSGIHSALSLFIAGLLLQHVLLQGTWKRVFFTLCIFPISIFKNAVRIVTIAWLGIHVNPDFFHGQLHRQGGLPFSLLAITLLGLLVWLLRRPAAFSRTQAASRHLNSGVA
jgi:exosortase